MYSLCHVGSCYYGALCHTSVIWRFQHPLVQECQCVQIKWLPTLYLYVPEDYLRCKVKILHNNFNYFTSRASNGHPIWVQTDYTCPLTVNLVQLMWCHTFVGRKNNTAMSDRIYCWQDESENEPPHTPCIVSVLVHTVELLLILILFVDAVPAGHSLAWRGGLPYLLKPYHFSAAVQGKTVSPKQLSVQLNSANSPLQVFINVSGSWLCLTVDKLELALWSLGMLLDLMGSQSFFCHFNSFFLRTMLSNPCTYHISASHTMHQ